METLVKKIKQNRSDGVCEIAPGVWCVDGKTGMYKQREDAVKAFKKLQERRSLFYYQSK